MLVGAEGLGFAGGNVFSSVTRASTTHVLAHPLATLKMAQERSAEVDAVVGYDCSTFPHQT